MTFERTKTLTTFAFFGFVVGTIAYFLFNWLVSNDLIRINLPTFPSLITSPWFMSGTIGAILSTVVLVIFSRFSKQ